MLCIHEDLRSDPSTHINTRCNCMQLYFSFGEVGRDKEILRGHPSVTTIKIVSSGFNEIHDLKYQREVTEEDT